MSKTPTPSMKAQAFCDVERELMITRKVLERLPQGEFAWQVHEKSMSLGRLAMHVATLPGWMLATLDHEELDVATMPPPPTEAKTTAEVLKIFDDNVAKTRTALDRITDQALMSDWSLRNGPTVLYTASKATVLRVWCVNHLVHHRAQLCVYLRIKNVPVPAVYFNSADEPEWLFS